MGQVANPDMIMVDFETLDTEATAVVLSAGIVRFNRDKILDVEYIEFDITTQIARGRTVSRDTQEWWIKQNPSEFERLMKDGQMPTSSFTDILVEMSKGCEFFWSRGGMDWDIAMNICGKYFPFHFWEQRDVRTLDALGIVKIKDAEHNALGDCKIQVEYVQEILALCQKLKSAPTA